MGLAPAIRKLADEDLSVTLAVSLHIPDDELRDTLVPVNNRWSVAEVLDAARYYADKSGRRVSIEYALIRDINDQPWRADMLGKKLHKALGSRVHVNVIPLNRPRAASGTPPRNLLSANSFGASTNRVCRVRSATPAARKSLLPAVNSPPRDELRLRLHLSPR